MGNMKTYELTYIISSALGATESDNLKKEVEDVIGEAQGTIIKSEKTLAQSLAYPIKKQSSGYYVITVFQILESKINSITSKLEKNANVLRQMIVVKKPIKEAKPRRVRKTTVPKTSPDPIRETKKTDSKVEMEEINKKLEEILQ